LRSDTAFPEVHSIHHSSLLPPNYIYIKPEDGFQLPAIMQWLKQTFAARFNRRDDRTGHLWGNRYWSCVLEGEPPEGAGEMDWEAVEAAAEPPTAADMRRRRNGVRPRQAEKGAEPPFSPEIPLRAASPPDVIRGKAPP
jgi:hypothetical protein